MSKTSNLILEHAEKIQHYVDKARDVQAEFEALNQPSPDPPEMSHSEAMALNPRPIKTMGNPRNRPRS